MADEIVQQALVRSIQKAYDEWAGRHPSLAAVIDRISLTQRAVDSLRDSEKYLSAVQAYHESKNEFELLEKLTALAGPVIQVILGS